MILYKNQSNVVLNSLDEYFYYEVELFYRYKNTYGLLNSVLYRSIQKIDFIPRIQINSYLLMITNLYAAPEIWLIQNSFTPYVKLKKGKHVISSI